MADQIETYHWVEADLTPFSRAKLTELFTSSDPAPGVQVVSVEVDGEAYANTRKGKRIIGYDLSVRAKCALGAPAESGPETSAGQSEGWIELPSVGEDTAGDETHVSVSFPDSHRAVAVQHRQGMITWARSMVTAFAEAVNGEAEARAPIVDGKAAVVSKSATAVKAGQEAPTASKAATAAPASSSSSSSTASATKSSGGKTTTTKTTTTTSSSSSSSSKRKYDFKITEDFSCNPMDLYESLIDPRRVMAWSQSPAEVDAKPGGRMTMFGGSIEAEFVRLEPGKVIEQKWRFRSWGDHFSTVIMTIDGIKHGQTRLTIDHRNLPNESEADTTKHGWSQNIMMRIRTVMGFGGAGVMSGVLG